MSLPSSAEADLTRPKSAGIDRSLELRRLARNVATVIAAHPKLTDLGHDDLVEHLADEHGFGRFDLSIHRVCVGAKIRTLVCVPERVLRHTSSRLQLLELKRAAIAAKNPIVIVHERFIQRQPRLGNLRMIEQAAEIRVRAEDRIALLVHLIENGGSSTVLECATAITHEAPIGLVLHLVADGVIGIRADKPFGPYTWVELVEAGRSVMATFNPSLIATLERLVRDLEAYAGGYEPDPLELADAPILNDWRIGHRVEIALHGCTTSHPMLPGARNLTTSALYHLDADGRWARTLNRVYRLGTPWADRFN